jgi:arylsulfatase A-like enzyme
MYIAYGETDEWAHGAMYKNYLDAAHQFDQYIKEIWIYLQSQQQYKNNTSIFISTDHGRGDLKKEEWTSHGSGISDSHEMWFAAMGPAIKPSGEIKQPMQLYQQQFAQTFAQLMNTNFTAIHPISAPLNVLLSR